MTRTLPLLVLLTIRYRCLFYVVTSWNHLCQSLPKRLLRNPPREFPPLLTYPDTDFLLSSFVLKNIIHNNISMNYLLFIVLS